MTDTYTARRSSVLSTLDIIGDRWMLMLIEAMFAGVESWSDLVALLRVSPSTLSKRLGQLIEAGCAEKTSAEKRGGGYRLTEKGIAMFPIFAASDEWRLAWDNPGQTVQPMWIHKCGQPLRSRSVCGRCERDVTLEGVTYREGPGAGPGLATAGRRFRNSRSGADDVKDGEDKPSRFLQAMGDRRAAQLLAAFFMGCHRFDEFEMHTGLHPAILSDRLRKFQLLGLAHTRLYQERPDRYLYSLSAPARSIFTITAQMMHWGDRFIHAPGEEPLILTHKACGERLQAVVRCSCCAQPVQHADVTPARLPGNPN